MLSHCLCPPATPRSVRQRTRERTPSNPFHTETTSAHYVGPPRSALFTRSYNLLRQALQSETPLSSVQPGPLPITGAAYLGASVPQPTLSARTTASDAASGQTLPPARPGGQSGRAPLPGYVPQTGFWREPSPPSLRRSNKQGGSGRALHGRYRGPAPTS